jgi:hypothetical protein
MVDSVLSTGLQGVLSGVENAQQAAQNIASATTIGSTNGEGQSAENPATVVELTEAVVDLKVSEQQVQASAAVIESADEMIGTLLDTTA